MRHEDAASVDTGRITCPSATAPTTNPDWSGIENRSLSWHIGD